jgi:hypothetical protein
MNMGQPNKVGRKKNKIPTRIITSDALRMFLGSYPIPVSKPTTTSRKAPYKLKAIPAKYP